MGLNRQLLWACGASLVFFGACVSGGGSSSGGTDETPAPLSDVSSLDSMAADSSGAGMDGASAGTDALALGDTAVGLDAQPATDSQAADTAIPQKEGQVTIVTTLGEFTIELALDKAPISCANFLEYVSKGFYDGDDGQGATTFHRIIAEFMIQGGGYLADNSFKQSGPAIVNESTNGLSNVRGSVAMARKTDPDTATSQFFVNHIDNDFLDYADPQNPGYAVFGHVVSGMDVVDAIATVQTDLADKPLEPIEIVDVLY
jgi:cyclophilin family peptidyl-prolyl cis-trans isomerase